MLNNVQTELNETKTEIYDYTYIIEIRNQNVLVDLHRNLSGVH